jgi:hypothetical protein
MFDRQRRHALRLHLLLGVLCAALSGACNVSEPRTQVMLILEAGSEVQERATLLRIVIESRGRTGTIEGNRTEDILPKDSGPDGPKWPYSIALVPRDRDPLRTFHVTATVSDSAGTQLAVLRAHSGFVAQRTIPLRLYFSNNCLDVDCREAETCIGGSCVPAEIDPDKLGSLEGDVTDNFAPTTDGGTSSTRGPVTMSGTSGSGGSGGSSGPKDPGAAGSGGSAPPVPTKAGDCGDGELNIGEECDTMIAPDQPGACPTVCSSEDPCDRPQLEGTQCTQRCMPNRITTMESGDGCCPDPNLDANSDMDCGAKCGNAKIEAGETCDPPEMCPTVESCMRANPCLRATLEGSADTCNVTCVMSPITECMADDNCCPETCNYERDNDCSPTCGNGVIDRGETCEMSSTTNPCPASCDSSMECTTIFAVGSVANCNRECQAVPILAPIGGDGCCLPYANANIDSDCMPRCGNGVTERPERCDGNCPTSCDDRNACTDDRLVGTAAGCDARCTNTPITAAKSGDGCCPTGANKNTDNDCTARCSNGAHEMGELCDGNCPTSCPAHADKCMENVVVGEPCQRVCEPRPRAPSLAGKDECCPADGTPANDSDCESTDPPDPMEPVCPTSCVEDSDPCTRVEPTVVGDVCICTPVQIANCEPPPTCPNGCNGIPCDTVRCPDGDDPCTIYTQMGTAAACDLRCEHTPRTPGESDGACCPATATFSTDPDCPGCGNRRKDPGEECDGSDCPDSCSPATDPCMVNRLVGSASNCDAKCVQEQKPSSPSGDGCCLASNPRQDNDCPGCGNGKTERDLGEECDNDSDPSCVNCMMVGNTPVDAGMF